MYYGMRSGHRPFNTPERYRGKTKVGIVGEMILEADEIVGHILDQLKESGVDENTVCYMKKNSIIFENYGWSNFYIPEVQNKFLVKFSSNLHRSSRDSKNCINVKYIPGGGNWIIYNFRKLLNYFLNRHWNSKCIRIAQLSLTRAYIFSTNIFNTIIFNTLFLNF